MSQPFRFLDLPAELQVVVLNFYFEAPFDIKVCRKWGWGIEEKYNTRFLATKDSRSAFAALWTSPKIYEQARQTYLQGFSGCLDASELKIDCGEAVRFIYELLSRTLPRTRVTRIELGLVIPAECPNRGVSEPSWDPEDPCEACEFDTFTMPPNLFDCLENLKTVSISLGWDCFHARTPPVKANEIARLVDGSVDVLFCRDMVQQLQRMNLLDSDGNPPKCNGRALALQVSIWDHIEYMPKGEGFPHEHATHKAEGYYYYCLRCQVYSSDRIDVVSRKITLTAPKNEWFIPNNFG